MNVFHYGGEWERSQPRLRSDKWPQLFYLTLRQISWAWDHAAEMFLILINLYIRGRSTKYYITRGVKGCITERSQSKLKSVRKGGDEMNGVIGHYHWLNWPMISYINWARRTGWGWWDDWDEPYSQTQSGVIPNSSPAKHTTSQSRRFPAILNLRVSGKRHFVQVLKLDGQSGVRTRDLWLYTQAASGIDTNWFFGVLAPLPPIYYLPDLLLTCVVCCDSRWNLKCCKLKLIAIGT